MGKSKATMAWVDFFCLDSCLYKSTLFLTVFGQLTIELILTIAAYLCVGSLSTGIARQTFVRGTLVIQGMGLMVLNFSFRFDLRWIKPVD